MRSQIFSKVTTFHVFQITQVNAPFWMYSAQTGHMILFLTDHTLMCQWAQLDGVDDLRILGEKIVGLGNGPGGLWFAGEHAGRSDLATVNGAMTSGSLAAVEVLKSLEQTIKVKRNILNCV